MKILPKDAQVDLARSSYNRLSRWYDYFSGSEWPFTSRALELLAVQPGERVLEIGCGTGRAISRLVNSVGQQGCVYGLDISEGMLSVAHRRLKGSSFCHRTAWVMGDALHLPIGVGLLDAVLLSFTLELFDPLVIPLILQQCHLALNHTGRLGVACMARRQPLTWMSRLYAWAQHGYPAIIDCRPIDVREYLVQAGFVVTNLEESLLWGLPVAVALGQKAEAYRS
jgi:ubiquinone/menaquinone biosynthesis C-methylase UbiE